MTQDELFKEFLQFIAYDSTFQSPEVVRSMIYWKVKGMDRKTIWPHGFGMGSHYKGLLYAFVAGIDLIDPEIELWLFDDRLEALADELLRHLKAELS